MQMQDIFVTLQWWGYLFVIGLIFFPLVARIFHGLVDKGYPFAKVIGATAISYVVFVLGVTHIAPFTQVTIFVVLALGAIGMTIFLFKNPQKNVFSKRSFFLFVFEEFLFLSGLFFWAWIRAHQPDIFGLEKYMDFGFLNSILRSTYFPPKDMWYTPLPINYYYFGHLITGVLTKLSAIPSYISFNLMLATLFGLTFSLSFSLIGNVWSHFIQTTKHKQRLLLSFISSGIIGGFLVSLGGNLHTIYTLFTTYQNDNPLPFWQLVFSPKSFPNAYWYPNATRFIYHTIHEFPSYSFVVSDLHGHVLDIPLVLTTMVLLFAYMVKPHEVKKGIFNLLLISFLLATMYMTNAWDAMIYFLLAAVVIFWKTKEQKNFLVATGYKLLIIFGGFLMFSLPFSLFFNPGALVGGIGLICSPQFLINVGKIGPFVFEANHCMHSPLWQLLILYGFFLFWFISFLFIFLRERKKLTDADIFIMMLSGMSFFLIIVPEFFYLRDIYTTYFRANTMFKLVYQAFIMFSLSIAFMIFRFAQLFKHSTFLKKLLLFPYLFIGIFFCILVGIYPYFAIASYYNSLTDYRGLNGNTYLSKSYFSDAQAITWMQQHIQGQPVILEAQGDSYTEYARVSANTGLPTVLGWPVHEWLWRGTYDIVPPRSTDIQTMYETSDPRIFKNLAAKYAVRLVFVGQLERTKYKVQEEKFQITGTIIYKNSMTTIYSVSL